MHEVITDLHPRKKKVKKCLTLTNITCIVPQASTMVSPTKDHAEASMETNIWGEWEKQHDENVSFGQSIPSFPKSVFFPLTCQSTCGLGERRYRPPPPPPKRDTHQLFMDHDWHGKPSYQRADYLRCWPQLLISLRLGLWPSESGTSEMVTKRGQKVWANFSKVRCKSLLFLIMRGIYPNEIFS